MSHFLTLINSMYQLELSLCLTTKTCTGLDPKPVQPSYSEPSPLRSS